MIPRHAHKRSLSSGHRSLSPDKTVTKAKSTTNLAEIAWQGENEPSEKFEESIFNTLQDPRLAHGSEVSQSTSSSHHPDLSNEVAALSVKLVQAINNQTTLDDNLVATRQELELAQGKVKALEFQNDKYRRDIAEKVYVKRSDADREILRLKTALVEEKAQRSVAEKGKKTIEQELETLTAALFEEANKVCPPSPSHPSQSPLNVLLTVSQMVAAAKIEREAVEKKNKQLRSQIKDTELLLASHQDQLAELKSAMQGRPSKDDVESRTAASTAPPSPVGPPQLQISAKQEPEIDSVPAPSCDPEELVPGPSCSFPQMIRMVCRTDLQAYEDFRDLMVLSRSSKPASRAGSGSYGGLNVMSLAGFATGGSNSATSSPSKGNTHSPNGSVSSQMGSHIPLKESRFYKRVLMEDIEPTLRLDLAPGISWLTRRTVMSGICEGSLVVEPMPNATKRFELPCSVCGERRPGLHNERTHRFRTSDSETAQRYPLCLLCLEKVRSCCEFTGYLRLILDGHLRPGDDEEEKEIWEETIHLRERMFWSRVGGGVLPLLSRPAELEAEPEIEEPNTDAVQEHFEEHRLHIVDHTSLAPKTVEVSPAAESTQAVTESIAIEVSVPQTTGLDTPTAALESPESPASEAPVDEPDTKQQTLEPQNFDLEKDETDSAQSVTEPVTTEVRIPQTTGTDAPTPAPETSTSEAPIIETDATKPQTPEPRNIDLEKDEAPSKAQSKRTSVHSEVSVYEEANADVAAETAETAKTAESAESAESAKIAETADPAVDQSSSTQGQETTEATPGQNSS
ncbi:hypothetical protein NUU61_000451 [Penicillium alfredii]|uniref:GDP/GTP exchange factor Sec2 N-terminal domain-containing protein n=1 Tax=Penicillium alfredii TaxID=1506179 RepID=A0A9W9KQX0_9EURO|nr:uncharacterized protein NUU61_000451 [Penicillium alfredii]KAJ5114692.1 hypothetical protein NUU61_000451 [Penicillium alfredii]